MTGPQRPVGYANLSCPRTLEIQSALPDLRNPAALRLPVSWPVVASLVGVAVFVILFLRLPEALLRAEFWSDDGAVYTQILASGARGIIEPYHNAGYLILAQSFVVYLETLLPPPLAPVLGNIAANVAVGAVAAYLVLGRFPWSRRTSVFMALVIPLVPSSFELIGTLSHVQWTIGLWMALVAIAAEPTTRLGRWIESGALLVAGLTGPLSIIFLPLFLWGPRRRLVITTITALVQLVVTIIGPRVPSVGLELDLMPYILVLRVLVTPVLGPTTAWVMPAFLVVIVGAAVALTVALLLRHLDRRIALWLVGLAILVPVAAFARTHYETEPFLHPYFAPRYFWMTGIAFVWLALLAMRASRPLPLAFLGLLVLGMVDDFRQPVRPPMGWETHSVCIGGPEPCVVAVPSVSDPSKWAVRWVPNPDDG